MSQIELSFISESTFGSHVIRWFTHSKFSHVDIILPDGRRLGARNDQPVRGHWGVQIRKPNYAVFKHDERLILPCSVRNANRAYEWLYNQVNKPYDKTGLYASFLFNRPQWRDEASWWCSELAAAFVEKAGFPICRCPVNRMTPNDTYIYAGCFAQ